MSMKKLVLVICAALVMGVSAWFFVLRENGNGCETFVVEPGDFIQQISIMGYIHYSAPMVFYDFIYYLACGSISMVSWFI